MNYENFVKEIHGEFEMLAERKGLSGRVVIRDIVKNNNVHLKSISVVNDENRATPTIYLESYYEEFCQGKDISDIANEIFEMYIMNSCGLNFSMEDFMNYSYIKNKIAYKVINYDMNREMLKTVPHLHILDLAIVFNIVIEEDAYNSATAMIKKEHLDMWQVSKKEIEEVALTNTPELMPPVIMRMEDLLAEMIINDISMQWDDEDEQEQWDFVKEDCAYGGHPKEKVSEYVREEIEKMKYDDKIDMYVLTNEKRINGAGTMFYDGLLKKFADKIEKDLIIIPSSVHEVILIPKDNEISDEEINEMIGEVNENELETVEILSDHMYLYCRREDRIYM